MPSLAATTSVGHACTEKDGRCLKSRFVLCSTKDARGDEDSFFSISLKRLFQLLCRTLRDCKRCEIALIEDLDETTGDETLEDREEELDEEEVDEDVEVFL